MNSRLAEQISYLLLRHEYVVVPQLGGFIREKLPANYDPTKRLAYPPSAELHFNQALIHSDGLLEGRYAELLGLSLRRARLVLEEEVRQLRLSLIKQGHYELSGIGELSLSQEGQLSFVPSAHALATQSASYGYAPLSLPELPSQQSRSKGARRSRSERDGRYISLRLSKRALGYAAVAIFTILALLPWGNRVETTAHYQAGFTPSIEAARQLFGEQEVVAEPRAQEQTKGGLSWSTEQDGRYYIVLATERTEERIQGYLTEVRDAFPEAHLIALRSPHGRTTRLCLTSFPSSAEAYAYLNTLVKEHPSYRSSWVFRNS